jgi:putative serine protease PepD
VALALVAAIVGGVVGGAIVARARPAPRTVVRTFSANTSRLSEPRDIQGILAKVEPATVAIRTQAFQGNDLFGTRVVAGAGTGMILTPDGEVLTNNHVIAGATSIKVTVFGQSDSRDADLLGSDAVDDVALVKIRGGAGLPAADLGDSDKAVVGDDVVAIGNALGLAGGPTVTEGIVSAKDRTVPAGNETLEGMLQTDAAINPGNSGGPLANGQAQVIGMNTAVATGAPGEPAQNVGFAIPVNRIKPLLPELRQGRTPVTAATFLGAALVTLTPDLRQQYGFTPDKGAVVGQVVPGSPADSAGLQPGDVVVSFDGQPVDSAEKLRSLIRRHKPGDRVQLTFVRGSTGHTVTAALGSRPVQGG